MKRLSIIISLYVFSFMFSSCDYNERVENSKNEEHIDYYEVTYVDGEKDTIQVWRIDGASDGIYIRRKKIEYRVPFVPNNFKTIYNTLHTKQINKETEE